MRFREGSTQEDEYNDMRNQDYEERRARNNRSCSDGFCGADDCERCRPGCTREMESECQNCHESFLAFGDEDSFCCEACEKEAIND